MIRLSKTYLGDEELMEINKVCETGWLGMGSVVLDFENQIKEYLNAKNVIAVNTGTSALHIAMDAAGIGEGDEVIVPSMTFCASIQAITVLGAIPVFCEVEEDTLNIDIDDLRKRITPKTRAIMPIHYCGNACDMDSLLEIASDSDITIVEDAAHAFGSSYKDKKIGSFGHITCFSFDPIKSLTCGEGGAVVLADDKIAEKVRQKRILGIDKDTWHRYKNERSWFYEVTMQGYRYHMSNINAAIGIAQLRKLDDFIEKRKKIAGEYSKMLTGLEDISLLKWNLKETVPFIYIVRVLNNKRDKLMNFLKEREIGGGVHYIANHIQPFFEKYTTNLPVTDRLWREILTLPLHCEMTDAEVALVAGAVREFLEQS